MSRLFAFLCIVVLLASVPDSSAQASPAPQKTQQTNSQGHPVMLGDQVLFYVRAIKAYPGRERAAVISGRLKRLAEDYDFSTDSITAVDSEFSTDIVTADRMIMSVHDSDAKAEGALRKELAERYVRTLRAGIEKYRQDYGRQALLLGIVYTLIATLFLIAFFYLFNKLYRKVNHMIQTWVGSKKISLHIQSFEIIRAGGRGGSSQP